MLFQITVRVSPMGYYGTISILMECITWKGKGNDLPSLRAIIFVWP